MVVGDMMGCTAAIFCWWKEVSLGRLLFDARDCSVDEEVDFGMFSFVVCLLFTTPRLPLSFVASFAGLVIICAYYLFPMNQPDEGERPCDKVLLDPLGDQ